MPMIAIPAVPTQVATPAKSTAARIASMFSTPIKKPVTDWQRTTIF
jgi:hypothetical protein